MSHPDSEHRAEALLKTATACWRKCGVAVLDAGEIAAALDEAWEAGRVFAAREARRYAHGAENYVYEQIIGARRPE